MLIDNMIEYTDILISRYSGLIRSKENFWIVQTLDKQEGQFLENKMT